MKEITNPFTEGEKVVCISNDFPIMKQYGGTENAAPSQPKINEVLVVDEILGDYLNFNKYDSEESYNWWHYSRFKKLTYMDQLCNLTEALYNIKD